MYQVALRSYYVPGLENKGRAMNKKVRGNCYIYETYIFVFPLKTALVFLELAL